MSSGDLLRNEVLGGSEKGKQLFSVMSQGLLVPDAEVVELIKVAMAAKAGNTKGFILDGFPANLAQAKLFVENIGAPTKIIVLNVNDILLKERLAKRSNFDDQPDAIAKRLDTFANQTKPVLKEFANLVMNVSIISIC